MFINVKVVASWELFVKIKMNTKVKTNLRPMKASFRDPKVIQFFNVSF